MYEKCWLTIINHIKCSKNELTKSQLSEENYVKRSDFVIDNNIDFSENDVLTIENMNEIINNIKLNHI
jgi:dephospho-CoA kinase